MTTPVAYGEHTFVHVAECGDGDATGRIAGAPAKNFESLPAFRELKMRAREPDLREWGDPSASAAEDTAITEELSGLLHDANSMH
jgi:hypothetical protein